MRKRNVLRCRRKIGKDGDDCTSGGREFQQLKTTGDRQLTVGKMARAVGMMSMSEASDGREGRRHEQTGLSMVAQALAVILYVVCRYGSFVRLI